MKQIKLLFDVSIIIEALNSKIANRSGIFWVAYNILLQFSKNPLYKITFFAPFGYTIPIETEFSNLFSSYPFFFLDKENKYKRNIEVHKQYIKNSKNILLIFIRYLKVLKNYFLLNFTDTSIKELQNFDIFFSPIYVIPDKIKNNSRIKSFHILYDCIPFMDEITHPSKDSGPWYIILPRNLNKKTYYFCISECTKNDFLNFFINKLDKKKMFVTPISTSQKFFPNYDKTSLQEVFYKYGITHKPTETYIFSLCNIDPRKNIIFTIKCFIKFIQKHNIKDMYFYFGGGHFLEYVEKFKQEISAFNEFSDKIVHLGYIDDEDVNILYSNSVFFTYLSQYEGFGIPPLEAMQSGTPVICSNNSSMPEVVQDAAIMIDYNSEEQCIKAFEDFYFNKDLREEFIKRGLERGKLFSWEKTFDLIHNEIITAMSFSDNGEK